MATFLRDKKVLETDVIAVQEPWKNEEQHTTHQPAAVTFQLLYPAKQTLRGRNQGQGQGPDPDPPQPGVCLFVSKKIDPATWSCQVISRDYQLLKLRKAHVGKDWTDLFVHNVYNRPGSNTLAQLKSELAKRPLAEHVVVGDMNAHHPVWGGVGTRVDDEAEQLLEITDEHDLDLITEEGKATWTRNDQSSVIELTFVSSSLSSRLIRCERAMLNIHPTISLSEQCSILKRQYAYRRNGEMGRQLTTLSSFGKSKKGYKQEISPKQT